LNHLVLEHLSGVKGGFPLEEAHYLKLSLFQGVEYLLTGETVRPSIGRVEPVRGCLNNPSRLEWTTLTSLTAPLAALRSPKKTKEKTDLN
jgi:hypothetical protein